MRQAVIGSSLHRIVFGRLPDSSEPADAKLRELLALYGATPVDAVLAADMWLELWEKFVGLATLLAVVGLYGVLAFLVTRRTREIGIRMALGATRVNVLQMVVREGLVLVVLGAIAGTIAALAGNKLISSLLYELKPVDPLSFVAALAVLLAVAFLASYLPARRATRIDPIVALRHE